MSDQDQTAAREASYAGRMGEQLGAFTIAAIDAYNLAADAAVERTIQKLGMPNVVAQGAVGEVSGRKLGFGIEMPAITMFNNRFLAPTAGKIVLNMSVSETNASKSNTSASAGMDAEVSAGWGPVKVRAKMNAQVSHGAEKSRSTDYSAKVQAELAMELMPEPEGVSLIVDAMNRIVKAAADAQAAKAVEAISTESETSDALPPAGGTAADGTAAA